MSLEALVYDTISATPQTFLLEAAASDVLSLPASVHPSPVAGKRKRRRRPRSCKNKEDAETQRMTHIAVERNRRRQMNEHLAVLRSLMPESYILKVFPFSPPSSSSSSSLNNPLMLSPCSSINEANLMRLQGDQASIVGGAIDFVKELEQLLQSLEAQKWTIRQPPKVNGGQIPKMSTSGAINETESGAMGLKDDDEVADLLPPFSQFFAYPQYNWCHAPPDYPPAAQESRAPAVADIEVTLVETHASLRILSPRRPRQLIRLVAALQALRLSVLHLNVTTLEAMVLYTLSLKVEEGCSLTTVDDIAAAVHRMLSLIESETSAMRQAYHEEHVAASAPRPPLPF
ncbi:Transcription factor bHLH96 [Apostasia shenzhenica]|uniref:Transcription factor bHLH96 n=1 Tax=Apostasia shenzhenica TaxID=1088818 RepID=A0A2I0AWU3_9ASPA|nr:Transcription factor bHLH96 [Apostasia shenzhenica]